MTDQTRPGAIVSNNALLGLWLIALFAIGGGLITIFVSAADAAGAAVAGFGGLALLLALTVQAIRAPR